MGKVACKVLDAIWVRVRESLRKFFACTEE
jgi:hypothetical protein